MIAEQAFRGGIARLDDAIQVLRNDRIVGRVDDCREIGFLVQKRPILFAAIAQRSLGLAPHARQLELRPDAREQFARAERLDEILISAGIQALDSRLLARACRQQNDRDRASPFVGADRGQEAEPIEPGHHHVGQHEIRSAPANPGQRIAAVADDIDTIALTENAAEIFAHVGVVVRDQHLWRGLRLSSSRAGDLRVVPAAWVVEIPSRAASAAFPQRRGSRRRSWPVAGSRRFVPTEGARFPCERSR